MNIGYDTEMGEYRIEDGYYNGRPARMLYSGDKDAALSGVAQDDDPDLLFDYNQRFMELVRGLRPSSLLVLGGGVFTLPSVVIKEFPEMRMDVVELDGGLYDAARQYFGFEPSEHTGVIVGDARHFVETTDNRYDLIIVDIFIRAVLPPAFQTSEIMQHLKRCLTKRGVVAFNVIASLRGGESVLLHRMYETMQATFLDVRVFPASHGISPWLHQNFIITAQDGSADIASYVRTSPVNSL